MKKWISIFLVSCASLTAEVSVENFVQSQNEFAFTLYRELSTEQGNIFFSPYSVSSGLTLAFTGARGETQQEMADVLHLSAEIASPIKALQLLNQQIASPELRIVNAVWAQSGLNIDPAFKNTLKDVDRSQWRWIDFAKNPTEALRAINGWVADETQGKIQNLLQPQDVTSNTRLLLANALYMKAPWVTPFDKKATQEGVFHGRKGDQKAMFMETKKRFSYEDAETYSVIDLPFESAENHKLVMRILLPKDVKGIDDFEELFALDMVIGAEERMHTEQVQVYLPKFKLTNRYDLNDPLKEMGMTTAFEPDADFSGITGQHDLSISKVVHKAFIDVDEAGVEAAAATAVSMHLTAIYTPGEPIVFRADHSFVFAIINQSTGAILFLGRLDQMP